MTDNELKKLKRDDLIELVISQRKEIERLKRESQLVRQKLENRNLPVTNAGSLVDAAIQIYQILTNAQKAADLYLESVKK